MFILTTCLVVKVFKQLQFLLKYFFNSPLLRNLYTILLLQSNLTISKPVDNDTIIIQHYSIRPHLLKSQETSEVLFLIIMDK
jgi:hypothetical protein